jgi:hypothetical protein
MQFKNNSVIFFRNRGWLGDAIIAAQDIYWKTEGKKSKWSHIGFVGPDGIFRESTVKLQWVPTGKKFLGINLKKLKYVYGIHRTELTERMNNWKEDYEEIGMQSDFKFKEQVWQEMADIGDDMYDRGYDYGGTELLGTLWTILKYKFTRNAEKRRNMLLERNPLDKIDDMYCIAFVARCFLRAGKQYINVHPSVSTVDAGWFTRMTHKEETELA